MNYYEKGKRHRRSARKGKRGCTIGGAILPLFHSKRLIYTDSERGKGGRFLMCLTPGEQQTTTLRAGLLHGFSTKG